MYEDCVLPTKDIIGGPNKQQVVFNTRAGTSTTITTLLGHAAFETRLLSPTLLQHVTVVVQAVCLHTEHTASSTHQKRKHAQAFGVRHTRKQEKRQPRDAARRASRELLGGFETHQAAKSFS